MSNVSRLLVVDASVLRSAGEKNGHSAHCSKVLNSILEICHRAAFCTETQQEWNKHQSGISSKWRAAMVARKKLVKTNISVHLRRISVDVDGLLDVTEVQRAALNKDAHLLAAAAHADHFIISGDKALKLLSDGYLKESVEWLVVSNDDSDQQRREQIDRLSQLAKQKPFPLLPP